MTPTRKRFVRMMARGSRHSVASQCLEDKVMRNLLIKKLGELLHSEVVLLCSDQVGSILQSRSLSDLGEFTWEKFYSELKQHAPLLLSILQQSTKTRVQRSNQKVVICLCVAIICKYRRPTMNLVQKIPSLILYTGHASKQVCIRLSACMNNFS